MRCRTPRAQLSPRAQALIRRLASSPQASGSRSSVEGANRRGPAQKRQRFVESRGECAEVAADLLLVLAIGSRTDAAELKHLAGRVSAMLTRLIARLE